LTSHCEEACEGCCYGSSALACWCRVRLSSPELPHQQAAQNGICSSSWRSSGDGAAACSHSKAKCQPGSHHHAAVADERRLQKTKEPEAVSLRAKIAPDKRMIMLMSSLPRTFSPASQLEDGAGSLVNSTVLSLDAVLVGLEGPLTARAGRSLSFTLFALLGLPPPLSLL